MLASSIIGTVLMLFLMAVTFILPEPTYYQEKVIHFFMALLAAFFGYFFIGNVSFSGTIHKHKIAAGGGIALFVFVQLYASPIVLREWAVNNFPNLVIADERLRDAELALSTIGYTIDGIDGKRSHATTVSIKTFQGVSGLTEDGYLSEKLFEKLHDALAPIYFDNQIQKETVDAPVASSYRTMPSAPAKPFTLTLEQEGQLTVEEIATRKITELISAAGPSALADQIARELGVLGIQISPTDEIWLQQQYTFFRLTFPNSEQTVFLVPAGYKPSNLLKTEWPGGEWNLYAINSGMTKKPVPLYAEVHRNDFVGQKTNGNGLKGTRFALESGREGITIKRISPSAPDIVTDIYIETRLAETALLTVSLTTKNRDQNTNGGPSADFAIWATAALLSGFGSPLDLKK